MVEPRSVSSVFADPAIQSAFDRLGYVEIPLLDAREVEQLASLWDDLDDPVKGRSLTTTIFSPSPAYRRAVSEGICSVVEPHIRQKMPQSRMIYGSFVVKQANDEQSPMPLHQDSSYVDESKYSAATAWIPLVDIDEQNGPLYVVPGSHRFNRLPRSFGSPIPYPELEPLLRDLAVPLSPRAGTALIFSQMIFHFSPPNRSSRVRVAGGGVVADASAPARFLWRDRDSNRIDAFEVEDEFFLSFDPFAAPRDRDAFESFPSIHEPLDRARVERIVEESLHA